jgi:hypothetical protein
MNPDQMNQWKKPAYMGESGYGSVPELGARQTMNPYMK